MRVNVAAFARLRELLGERRTVDCEKGTTAAGLWKILVDAEPRLTPFAASTRFARNGRLVSERETLQDGDDVALLPPVGGG